MANEGESSQSKGESSEEYEGKASAEEGESSEVESNSDKAPLVPVMKVTPVGQSHDAKPNAKGTSPTGYDALRRNS